MTILLWILISLIFYTYIAYPGLLYVMYKIFPKWRIGKSEKLPFVSMLIAAYNEESIIMDKIKNCLSINYPKENIEILIGSDGSNDATVEILNKNNYSHIRIFDFKKRRGKINVLKDLVDSARGEILVFSDANTMYEPDALARLVAYFVDYRIGCVCGRLKLKSSDKSKEGEYEGLYWKYESFIKHIEGELGTVLGANGAIYSIRKDLFPNIPNNTIIEDFVIPMKILERGYKTVYEKEAVAYEEASKTIADESRRKMRIGAGAYQTLFLTLPMLNIFKGLPSFAYWSHKVIRWFVPFFMVIIFILNMCLINDPVYLTLFFVQIALYVGALAGYLISKTEMHSRVFALLYYFVSMNISLLVGFFRFARGAQKVTWKRVER